jgi:hypothetical protein
VALEVLSRLLMSAPAGLTTDRGAVTLEREGSTITTKVGTYNHGSLRYLPNSVEVLMPCRPSASF